PSRARARHRVRDRAPGAGRGAVRPGCARPGRGPLTRWAWYGRPCGAPGWGAYGWRDDSSDSEKETYTPLWLDVADSTPNWSGAATRVPGPMRLNSSRQAGSVWQAPSPPRPRPRWVSTRRSWWSRLTTSRCTSPG